VTELKQNEPVKKKKYLVYKSHTCANRNQIYESKHMYQSRIRQILSNPTLLPLFSLNAKPHLEPDLYQTLKQWVNNEDKLIIDNKALLEEDMGIKQPLSEVYMSL